MASEDSQNSIREVSIKAPGRLDRLLKSLKNGDLRALSSRVWREALKLGWIRDESGRECKGGDYIEKPCTLYFSLPVRELGIQCSPGGEMPIAWSKDRTLFVFNKRPGIPSYPLWPWEYGCTVNFIADYLNNESVLTPNEFGQLGPFPKLEGGLVHRLDNHTSGVLMVATTKEKKEIVRHAFSSHNVLKSYWALVLGRVKNFDPIREVAFVQISSKRVQVIDPKDVDRDDIQTGTYELKALSSTDDYSLVEIKTRFGIRHQVRAYLSYLGNPLVGDFLYQSEQQCEINQFEISNHQLHARSLEYDGQTFVADPPDSFLANLKKLGLYYEE